MCTRTRAVSAWTRSGSSSDSFSVGSAPPGAVARMREDLVFDAAPARRDFGYDPRPFHPTAATFFPDADL